MDDYRLDAPSMSAQVPQQESVPAVQPVHQAVHHDRVNFVLNLLTKLLIYAVVFLAGFIFAKLQTLFSSF